MESLGPRFLPMEVTGSRRVQRLKPSVWVEIEENKCEADLSFGCPDYDAAPPGACQMFSDAIIGPDSVAINQYSRFMGHPRLMKALAKLYSPLLNHTINPMDEIVVGTGADGCLFYCFMGLLNPGDEVIIIEPCYDQYEPMTLLADAVPVFVPLKLERTGDGLLRSSDFKLDANALEKAITNRTKMIVLNNPNNPIGKVYTKPELSDIAKIAEKYNLLVLSDEVYEWLIYDNHEHIRFASLPNMWERTITVGSAGKTFSVTGWKVGWAIAPKNITHALQATLRKVVGCCATVVQEAAALCFEKELQRWDQADCYFKALARDQLCAKRDRMVQILTTAGFRPVVPDAGYMVLADFSNFAGAGLKCEDSCNRGKDVEFARWLAKNYSIAVMPPSIFCSTENKSLLQSFVRFCFFKQTTTLDRAELLLKNRAT